MLPRRFIIDLFNHWFVSAQISMTVGTLDQVRLRLHVPGAVWYGGKCSTKDTPDVPAGLETPQKLPTCCNWNESLRI